MNEIVFETSSKLNGVILRKAEMENDFGKVYKKVFEKMVEMEEFGSEILEIFGDQGG